MQDYESEGRRFESCRARYIKCCFAGVLAWAKRLTVCRLPLIYHLSFSHWPTIFPPMPRLASERNHRDFVEQRLYARSCVSTAGLTRATDLTQRSTFSGAAVQQVE